MPRAGTRLTTALEERRPSLCTSMLRSPWQEGALRGARLRPLPRPCRLRALLVHPAPIRGSCPMAWGINSCSLPSRRKRHDHTGRRLTAAPPAVPGTPRVPAAVLPLLAGRGLRARIWNRLCKRWQIATWPRAWVFRKSRTARGRQTVHRAGARLALWSPGSPREKSWERRWEAVPRETGVWNHPAPAASCGGATLKPQAGDTHSRGLWAPEGQ